MPPRTKEPTHYEALSSWTRLLLLQGKLQAEFQDVVMMADLTGKLIMVARERRKT